MRSVNKHENKKIQEVGDKPTSYDQSNNIYYDGVHTRF